MGLTQGYSVALEDFKKGGTCSDFYLLLAMVEDCRLDDNRKGVEPFLIGVPFTKIQSTEGKLTSEKARMSLALCSVNLRYLRDSYEVSIRELKIRVCTQGSRLGNALSTNKKIYKILAPRAVGIEMETSTPGKAGKCSRQRR